MTGMDFSNMPGYGFFAAWLLVIVIAATFCGAYVGYHYGHVSAVPRECRCVVAP